MRLEITGRHFDVTPAIKTYINTRLKKLPRILGDQAQVHVILSIEKYRHIAEINLSSKIGQVTCLETTTDMYASINRALAKLEKRALKFKQKRITSKRSKAAPKIDSSNNNLSIDTELDSIPKTVFRMEISKKPMAFEEAVATLSKSTDSFIVFRDAESQLINVLYKLKDGNFGLISPEE